MMKYDAVDASIRYRVCGRGCHFHIFFPADTFLGDIDSLKVITAVIVDIKAEMDERQKAPSSMLCYVEEVRRLSNG